MLDPIGEEEAGDYELGEPEEHPEEVFPCQRTPLLSLGIKDDLLTASSAIAGTPGGREKSLRHEERHKPSRNAAGAVAFNAVIFVAALWALSTEMVEDSVVDLIYGQVFGWRTLVRALAVASVVVVSLAAAVILAASTYLVMYVGLIQKGAAVLLGGIGAFWLGRSVFGGENEFEEARSLVGNFPMALQLVSIEELEIVLIVVPLVLASHALEATSAAAVGILVSVSLAALLRKPFSRFVEGRMRTLKVASGLFLILLGIVLFLD